MIVRIIEVSRTASASKPLSTETKDVFASYPVFGWESLRRTG